MKKYTEEQVAAMRELALCFNAFSASPDERERMRRCLENLIEKGRERGL